jgi:hypothetical protein
VPTTYDTIQQRQSDLIRRALEGSIFIAPYTATLPTALTSGAGGDLTALPAGYEDVGWTDKKNGATWSRKPTTTDTTSWGSLEPTRQDITADVRTLKFIAQETKRLSLQLYEGTDLTGVAPDATTGEVSFSPATRPNTIFYRVFGLFVDGAAGHEIYVGRLLPRAIVTDLGDQVWTDDGDVAGYEVTLTATVDATAGYAVRHFFGGPGWQELVSEMGWAAS